MVGAGELTVEITVSAGVPARGIERLQSLLAYAAAREHATGEVALWICRDDEIADLHQRFMHIPGPTDVLSFPSGDPTSAGGHLGDIAVSFDTASGQAADAGHSVGRELAYLTLHGLLHLLGYADLGAESRARMIARQDQLLERFEEEQPGAWE